MAADVIGWRIRPETFLLYAPGVQANAEYLGGFYARLTPEGWREMRAASRVGLPPHVAVEPGRNGPCPCGSGAKFKRCCGA